MSGPATQPPKRGPTLRLGITSALLLWLAQPPVGCWPLAWLAPVGWLRIAQRTTPLDRGDWLRVYLSGVLYWLLAVHWVRLPHPLTPIGWLFLAAYLGGYPTAFVGLTRLAVHRRSIPLWIAAPIVWTGLELLQARLFTGFLMGALSHTQAGQLWLIQLADMVGAYGITFLMMMVTACLFEMTTGPRCWRHRIAMPLVASLLLVAAYAYANTLPEIPFDRTLTVALIQGDTRATWDPDPERSRRIMDRQTKISLDAIRQATSQGKSIDLMVWPESMFRSPFETFEGAFKPPPGTHENLVRSNQHTRAWLSLLATRLKTPLLVGIDHYDWQPDPDDPSGDPTPHSYNSALLTDAQGEPVALYDKTHRVPFGEYVPFASGMPALYYLTPMASGLRPGAGPVTMPLGDSIRIAPSICYETVVPHVIRRHVAELTDRGERPDLLVNVTNDAWFWGSSELDMHLACAIFRAVETRTPIAIAANGGLSAVVSARGWVLAISPRMREHALVVEVPLAVGSEASPYVRHGDWFSGGCLIVCGLLAILAFPFRSCFSYSPVVR